MLKILNFMGRFNNKKKAKRSYPSKNAVNLGIACGFTIIWVVWGLPHILGASNDIVQYHWNSKMGNYSTSGKGTIVIATSLICFLLTYMIIKKIYEYFETRD